MSKQYKVLFSSLQNTDQDSARTALIEKLKLTSAQATRFLDGGSVFAPTSADKAKKQQTLLSSMGIVTKINTLQAAAVSNRPDQHTMAALDYLTSSIMRIEERLESIEMQLLEQANQAPQNTNDDLELSLDDEAVEPPSSNNQTLIYLLAAAVLLLILLGVYSLYPELFTGT